MDRLKLKSKDEREAFLSTLSKEEIIDLAHSPAAHLRPSQLYPGNTHPVLMYRCGRGWGKTQTASMMIRHIVENELVPKGDPSIAIVGKTSFDVKRIMVNGPSGILAMSHPMDRPVYKPTERLITWSNGIKAMTFSADEYEQLRGPNLAFAWVDEMCKFQYERQLWDQLNLTLRAGEHPQILITTTPKPTELIEELSNDPTTYLVQRPSYDNFSHMASRFFSYTLDRLERADPDLADQEIYGDVLKANPNAIFTQEMFNNTRHILEIDGSTFLKEFQKFVESMDVIIVSIDPAISEDENSDLTGITVNGMREEEDGEMHGYLLEDGTLKGDADDWAQRAIDLYDKYSASYIVVEKNQGGNMISSVIHNNRRAIDVQLRQSVKSKGDRARPVAALYKQGLIHNVGHNGDDGDNNFLLLEQECTKFNPKLGKKQKSPDRMDALVIGFNELFEEYQSPNLDFWVA